LNLSSLKIIRNIFLFLFLLGFRGGFSQMDSSAVLNFNFNNRTFDEADGLINTKPVGVSLVNDRFGNERSALYVHGNANSYLNLGTSDLLKPKKGTILLWVKLERKVFTGRGYEENPIIETKNSPSENFYDAYTLYYDFASNRFIVVTTKDSTNAATINSLDTAVFNKWYHMVFTYNNDHLAFYIDGKLQQATFKGFETVFLQSDSVVIGNSASKKNDRCSRGIIDDITIFHRVLSQGEIEDLYNAPNPNRNVLLFNTFLKYIGILAAIFAFSYLLVRRRRIALRKEKEKFELMNRFHEMEIRTLKAQMNPHFIFNSLNSILQFIMKQENSKAELYLTKFSKLMRQILESNIQENIAIREEVDLLTAYIEIEAMRFNKLFNCNIRVDEKIPSEKTFIPHLMIQPFVENAIWHGLLAKKDNRELSISFEYVSDKILRCIIEDNGVGREVNKNKQETFKKTSLALSFIKQRLELMSKINNDNYYVSIIDKKDDQNNALGTKIILVLPFLNK
jgi:hypothetical protein